jgi:hypothetical protein
MSVCWASAIAIQALALAAGQLVQRPFAQVGCLRDGERGLDGHLVLPRPLARELLVRIAPARDEIPHGDALRRDR